MTSNLNNTDKERELSTTGAPRATDQRPRHHHPLPHQPLRKTPAPAQASTTTEKPEKPRLPLVARGSPRRYPSSDTGLGSLVVRPLEHWKERPHPRQVPRNSEGQRAEALCSAQGFKAAHPRLSTRACDYAQMGRPRNAHQCLRGSDLQAVQTRPHVRAAPCGSEQKDTALTSSAKKSGGFREKKEPQWGEKN